MRKIRFLSLSILCLIIVLVLFLFLRKTHSQDRILKLGAGEQQGTYEAFAHGLKEVGLDLDPPLHLEIQQSTGSLENLKNLGAGHLQLAMIQNGQQSETPLSVIARLHEEVIHLLVPKDSTIQTLADLAGKRLCLGQHGSGTRAVALNLLSHYGLQKNDFSDLPLAPQEAGQALLKGDADLLVMVTGLRAPLIEELLGSQKVRFISLGDPDRRGNIAEGIHAHYPHLKPYVIPRHTYATHHARSNALPEEPISTLSVSSLLVCRPDLSEATVQHLVEGLFTHRTTLFRHTIDSWPLKELTPQDVFLYPIHKGAEKFYRRHEPGFFVRYSEVLAFILAVFLALIGMISALKQWLESKRKNRIDTYYERVNAIIEAIHHAPHEDLEAHEHDLRALTREAFRDLVNEDLEANESFRIFQTLSDQAFEELSWRKKQDLNEAL